VHGVTEAEVQREAVYFGVADDMFPGGSRGSGSQGVRGSGGDAAAALRKPKPAKPKPAKHKPARARRRRHHGDGQSDCDDDGHQNRHRQRIGDSKRKTGDAAPPRPSSSSSSSSCDREVEQWLVDHGLADKRGFVQMLRASVDRPGELPNLAPAQIGALRATLKPAMRNVFDAALSRIETSLLTRHGMDGTGAAGGGGSSAADGGGGTSAPRTPPRRHQLPMLLASQRGGALGGGHAASSSSYAALPALASPLSLRLPMLASRSDSSLSHLPASATMASRLAKWARLHGLHKQQPFVSMLCDAVEEPEELLELADMQLLELRASLRMAAQTRFKEALLMLADDADASGSDSDCSTE
jgi:hypothetical protein